MDSEIKYRTSRPPESIQVGLRALMVAPIINKKVRIEGQTTEEELATAGEGSETEPSLSASFFEFEKGDHSTLKLLMAILTIAMPVNGKSPVCIKGRAWTIWKWWLSTLHIRKEILHAGEYLYAHYITRLVFSDGLRTTNTNKLEVNKTVPLFPESANKAKL
jgi:hypothetical protein